MTDSPAFECGSKHGKNYHRVKNGTDLYLSQHTSHAYYGKAYYWLQ